MKSFLCVFPLLLFVFCTFLQSAAQPVPGRYHVTGYQFTGNMYYGSSDPAVSDSIDMIKTISLQDGWYKASSFGVGNNIPDLMGFSFTVGDDSTLNNFYTGEGSTEYGYLGFLYTDNIVHISPYPYTIPGCTSEVYNNTYKPSQYTFYMHYGLGVETEYPEDCYMAIYEKWELTEPVSISSFSPQSGTAGTVVSISGKHFLRDSVLLVTAGGTPVDFTIISDTTMQATLGVGSTGSFTITTPFEAGVSADTFTYTPPVVADDTTWHVAGSKYGFSAGGAGFVSIAMGADGQPLVAFQDSTDGNKAKVMRLGTDSIWYTLGGAVSDGLATRMSIVVGSDNVPYVAYADAGNFITVKKFTTAGWQIVGAGGVLQPLQPATGKLMMALDGNNQVYLLAQSSEESQDHRWFNKAVYIVHHTGWMPFAEELEYFSGEKGSTHDFGDAAMTIYKRTNDVFIMSDDGTADHHVVVQESTGMYWFLFGKGGFPEATPGILNPQIAVDTSGVPVVSFQENDGSGRLSVYQFNGYNWNSAGSPNFSPSHTSQPSLDLVNAEFPYVFFNDYSYNGLGTVMTTSLSGNETWELAGAKGFVPSLFLSPHALVVNNEGVPYIAYSDSTHEYKVTVRYLPVALQVLPVSLLSFTASEQNHSAVLSWQTTNEINTSYFTVQRSTDGIHFTNIGKINAAGTGGNHSYTHQDNVSGLASATIYYRLQMVDKDGSSKESSIVSLSLSTNQKIMIVPNPARSYFMVSGNLAAKNTMLITDMSGTVVLVKNIVTSNEKIDISALAKGIYLVKMDDGKFSTVKKLIVE